MSISNGWATFDKRRKYRFTLGRLWDEDLPRCAFIMLNPSTADENALDPTVRRCVGYAKAWGFGSLEVGNLFALRSTDPRSLVAHRDPVGPGNDEALIGIQDRATRVVAAWGNWGSLMGRGQAVGRMLGSRGTLVCLLVTKSGEPGHPLYVSGKAEPFAWRPTEKNLHIPVEDNKTAHEGGR